MRLASRLFVVTTLLAALTVMALVIAADRILRERLENEVAANLEREARLVAALLPGDSTRWPEAARDLGFLIGRRVTLIAPDGRVLGDTDFDRPALARLENHGTRPEVRTALESGAGRDRRVSASNNNPQLYVAVRGGPPGVAAVRISASLSSVDAHVASLQRAVALAGLLAVLAAGLLAWPLTRALVRPLTLLTDAARQVAGGREPAFPDSRVPEIAEHVVALRSMASELAARVDGLRREREEAHTLIESLADGVIAAGPDGTVVTCNGAARRLLGYGDDAPLSPIAELFHAKQARELLRAALAGQAVERAELVLDDRELLVDARPLAGGGVLLVLQDVTRVRRLEAVRRDFVANVSHELKTPLTSIAGYAETLAGQPDLDTDARRFAETIVSNARRMQRLVDDLLDLARVESGSWRPAPQPVDIERAVSEAWSALGDHATTPRPALQTDIAPGARSVRVDPLALRQILTNLLDNAVRHTPPGGTITVTAGTSREFVSVAVSDTGSGIPSEHLPRIFERFYRVDPARSRADGGTGLGLAIVKHLVEAHGGRVEAESQIGRGTTIRMVLPA